MYADDSSISDRSSQLIGRKRNRCQLLPYRQEKASGHLRQSRDSAVRLATRVGGLVIPVVLASLKVRMARFGLLPAVVQPDGNSVSACCVPRRSLEYIPPVPFDEFALGRMLRELGHLDFSALVPKEPSARLGRGGRER